MRDEQILIKTVCNGDSATKHPGIREISLGLVLDLYSLGLSFGELEQ